MMGANARMLAPHRSMALERNTGADSLAGRQALCASWGKAQKRSHSSASKAFGEACLEGGILLPVDVFPLRSRERRRMTTAAYPESSYRKALQACPASHLELCPPRALEKLISAPKAVQPAHSVLNSYSCCRNSRSPCEPSAASRPAGCAPSNPSQVKAP